jgi:diguanylate cyclase (GGDEF)-like protein
MKKDYFELNKNPIFYISIITLLIFTISFSVLYYIEKETSTTVFNEIKKQEELVINLENDFLGREFDMVISDVNYLQSAYEDEISDKTKYSDLINDWIEFSDKKQIYDQIRYIDFDGNEVIRINYNSNGSYSVGKSGLQNKADRYYFTESVNLRRGSVYVSKFDLNIENKEIETSYKPMIRFATPVFNKNGDSIGIIIVNYLAQNLLTPFREIAKNSKGEVFLINSDGYSLSSDDANNDWNFMFNDKKEKSFKTDYGNDWNLIFSNEKQFTTNTGLFTSISVDLVQKYENNKIQLQSLILGDDKWYIVSLIKSDEKYKNLINLNFFSIINQVINKNKIYFIFILFISIILGFLLYSNRKNYLKVKFFSEYDSLTKVFNRRAGITKLNSILPTDDRRNITVSLCFADINGLKQVNDTLGHNFGDELIVTVSEIIKRTIREEDFIIRLGGDEFLIVFKDISNELAENVWTRIVQEFNSININENRKYLISVSHGISQFNNIQRSKIDDLILEADEKMYQEKKIIKTNFNVIKKEY